MTAGVSRADVPETEQTVSMNIVGVVRNGGDALKQTIGQIERLTSCLGRFQIVIATNDNTDDTDHTLVDYAERCSDIRILRLDGITTDVSERVERITVARNAVLEELEKNEPGNALTLVLDLDGPNVCLDEKAVLAAARKVAPEWDALLANSRPAYYDIYALRCTGWCDEDVWQRIHNARKPLFGRKKWRRNLLKTAIYDRQFDIPENSQMIPVDSAFAGAGLYKTKALKGLRYACRDERGSLVCEHVMLHKTMRERGARLFIEPALTTIAPAEHLGEGSGALLPPLLMNRISGTN